MVFRFWFFCLFIALLFIVCAVYACLVLFSGYLFGDFVLLLHLLLGLVILIWCWFSVCYLVVMAFGLVIWV